MNIELDRLRVTYGETVAVDDLTLSLAGDRIYGLLGRNGSGKTSVLSAVAALRKPSGGAVRVDGRPVFENPSVTSEVCLVPESGGMSDPTDTIRDAIAVAEYLRPRWDGKYADRLLELFEIDKRKKLRELSRGKRSAYGIVVGLAARAPVTLFDESHLGMDVPSRNQFHDELLADFMANPRTIVISTHLIEEVSALFEEVVIIDRGRLVVRDETDALRARGVALTGNAEDVDRFMADVGGGLTVLDRKQLGRTRSIMVYGALPEADRRRARDAGLELGPIALQELFVHLTDPARIPGSDEGALR